jgi:hypothetical protein
VVGVGVGGQMHTDTAGGTAVFLVGHEIGTILLGAALWRARTVPKWAAILFIIAPVAHFAAVLAGVRWLDILAFSVLTIGAATVARAIATTPDDDWDLPPTAFQGEKAMADVVAR